MQGKHTEGKNIPYKKIYIKSKYRSFHWKRRTNVLVIEDLCEIIGFIAFWFIPGKTLNLE